MACFEKKSNVKNIQSIHWIFIAEQYLKITTKTKIGQMEIFGEKIQTYLIETKSSWPQKYYCKIRLLSNFQTLWSASVRYLSII